MSDLPVLGPGLSSAGPPARRPEAGDRAGVGEGDRGTRLGLRVIALGYLAALLLAPVAMIFYRTFAHGLEPVWNAITQPNAIHAFWLSIELVAIAVPLNTAFGIGIALLLERGTFRGR